MCACQLLWSIDVAYEDIRNYHCLDYEKIKVISMKEQDIELLTDKC